MSVEICINLNVFEKCKRLIASLSEFLYLKHVEYLHDHDLLARTGSDFYAKYLFIEDMIKNKQGKMLNVGVNQYAIEGSDELFKVLIAKQKDMLEDMQKARAKVKTPLASVILDELIDIMQRDIFTKKT